MADVFYGQDRGDDDGNPQVVTVGAATGSTDIEVRIDTGVGWTRDEALKAIENIKNRVLSGLTEEFPDG